ncbi:MAG TPA: RNA polymerase sigma factor [Candidatus Krumholzibacteria bacterium]|nr:RNA polymerase sigma factor [Candidatus Krumholzibacteria bacterium]
MGQQLAHKQEQKGARTQSDESLFARFCESGDEHAIGKLVLRHHRRLLRFVGRWIERESVAEEVVQEAWLVVLSHSEEFRGESKFSTWLRGVVKNLALAKLREEGKFPRGVRGRAQNKAAEPGDGEFLAWLDTCPVDPHFPLQRCKCPERRAVLRDALGRLSGFMADLPFMQQQVLRLNLQGRAPNEVCAELEVTEANRRVLLHRARASISRRLSRCEKCCPSEKPQAGSADSGCCGPSNRCGDCSD